MKTITTKSLDIQIKALRTKIANAIPFKEKEEDGKKVRYKKTPYTISYNMLSECEPFIFCYLEDEMIQIDEKALRKAKKKLFEKLVHEYS